MNILLVILIGVCVIVVAIVVWFLTIRWMEDSRMRSRSKNSNNELRNLLKW